MLELLGPLPLLLLCLLSYLVTGGNYTLYLAYYTVGRDARSLATSSDYSERLGFIKTIWGNPVSTSSGPR